MFSLKKLFFILPALSTISTFTSWQGYNQIPYPQQYYPQQPNYSQPHQAILATVGNTVSIDNNIMDLNLAWNYTLLYPNAHCEALSSILQRDGQILFFTGKVNNSTPTCRYLGNLKEPKPSDLTLYRLVQGNYPLPVLETDKFLATLLSQINTLQPWDVNRVNITQQLSGQWFPLNTPIYYNPPLVQSHPSNNLPNMVQQFTTAHTSPQKPSAKLEQIITSEKIIADTNRPKLSEAIAPQEIIGQPSTLQSSLPPKTFDRGIIPERIIAETCSVESAPLPIKTFSRENIAALAIQSTTRTQVTLKLSQPEFIQGDDELLNEVIKRTQNHKNNCFNLINEAAELAVKQVDLKDDRWLPFKMATNHNINQFLNINFENKKQQEEYTLRMQAICVALTQDNFPNNEVRKKLNLYCFGSENGFTSIVDNKERSLLLQQKILAKTSSRTNSHNPTSNKNNNLCTLFDIEGVKLQVKVDPNTLSHLQSQLQPDNEANEKKNFLEVLDTISKDPQNSHCNIDLERQQRLHTFFMSELQHTAGLSIFRAFISLNTFNIQNQQDINILKKKLTERFRDEANLLITNLDDINKEVALRVQVDRYIKSLEEQNKLNSNESDPLTRLIQYCSISQLLPDRLHIKQPADLIPLFIAQRVTLDMLSNIIIQIPQTKNKSSSFHQFFSPFQKVKEHFTNKLEKSLSEITHTIFLHMIEHAIESKKISIEHTKIITQLLSQYTQTEKSLTTEEIKKIYQSWLLTTTLTAQNVTSTKKFHAECSETLYSILEKSTSDDGEQLQSLKDLVKFSLPTTSPDEKLELAQKIVYNTYNNPTLTFTEKNEYLLSLLRTFDSLLLLKAAQKEQFLKETLSPTDTIIEYNKEQAPSIAGMSLGDFERAFDIYRQANTSDNSKENFYFTHPYEKFNDKINQKNKLTTKNKEQENTFAELLTNRAKYAAENNLTSDQLLVLYYLLGYLEFKDKEQSKLLKEQKKAIQSTYNNLSPEIQTYARFYKPTLLDRYEIYNN